MKTRLVCTLALVAIAAAPVAAAHKCAPVANSGSILHAGAHVMLGEMHGTTETQALFASLACAAAPFAPLRVGLELPADEQPRLDKFLLSAGSDADRRALLSGPFWNAKFQDGRRSVAMAGLLESLRALKKEGVDVRVIAFDLADGEKRADRDVAMAEKLAAAFTAEPKATFLALAGNLHARKAAHPQFPGTFMAQELVKRGHALITLDARYGVGESWSCSNADDCGPHALGRDAAPPAGITLTPTEAGAYDGTYSIGVPTFSPPATIPMTAKQKQQLATVALEHKATRAYSAKKFSECGDLYVEMQRSAGDVDGFYSYSAACCYALGNDRDRAFAQLGTAVDHGFKDRPWLDKDDDLVSLRSDGRWAPLVSRIPIDPAPAK